MNEITTVPPTNPATLARTARALCLALAVGAGLAVGATAPLAPFTPAAEAQAARRPSAVEARLKAKLAEQEKRLGAEHPDLVPTLTELANFYRYWRRFAEAEAALKRALAIQEKSLGPNDPRIAATLGKLATLYKAQGRAGEAEAATKRAAVLGAARARTAKAEPKDAAKPSPGPAPVETGRSPAAERKPLARELPPPAPAAKPAPAPPPPAPEATAPKPAQPPAAAEEVGEPEPPAETVERDGDLDDQRPVKEDAAERQMRRSDEAREIAAREEVGRQQEEEKATAAAEPEAMSRDGGAAPEPDDVTASRGLTGTGQPPAGSASRAPAPAAGSGAPATPPGSADTVGGAARAPPADYDVVPVFYGTDRKVEPDPKRLRYGAERARELQLGRALVTVPALHKVPNVERPWALTIPYWNVTVWEGREDPKRHFTVKEILGLSKPEFLRLVGERLGKSKAFEKHAVVFVHGFNTSFDNALYRTAQIAYDLHFDGAPFLYSWPSAGDVAAYTSDRERAEQSKKFMLEFMRVVINETGAKSVSLIAHSMGNLPLLDVLKDLRNEKPNDVVISQVILAAPDVDRNTFEDLVAAFRGCAKGVTLYAASNDRALQISRNIWGEPRAGDVPSDGPLVIPDVDTIDVTAASTDTLSLNHSGYATKNALLNDIGLVIQTGERPPDKRFPILRPLKTAKGSYWQYPPNR